MQAAGDSRRTFFSQHTSDLDAIIGRLKNPPARGLNIPEGVPSNSLVVSDEDSGAASPRRGTLRASLVVGLLSLLVYTANFRSISGGDTYPARYLPFAIWHWHTVFLDPIVELAAQGRIPVRPRGQPRAAIDSNPAYWIVQLRGGHAVSLYPLVVPMLVSPLYLPAVTYLHATGWDPKQLDRIARIMEKVSASLVAAASVALFYLLLRRRAGPRSALLLTFAYAFGTTTWVISGQALWQHGVGELLVVSALLLLTGTCTPGRVVAAGLVLGLITCNRPPDIIIAAALGAYGLWWARRWAPLLVTAAMLPAVPLLVYNLGYVGHLAGAYGLVGDRQYFGHDVPSGLAGLLFSPTKGLLVFSPFLMFVPFCVPTLLRDDETRGLAIAALVAVVLQLLVYAKADWRQGISWGPRWLTDLVPMLVWILMPVMAMRSKAARAVFVVAVAIAVGIETVGAFYYTGASDVVIHDIPDGPNQMQEAWAVRNAPFIAEPRHVRPPFELTTHVQGFLDVMTTGDGAGSRAIDVAGWALADRRMPWEVIGLLDGRPVASTRVFFPRPDVTKALGVDDQSAWHLTLPADGLSPGEHLVAVMVRAHQGGDIRLLAERRFDEKPDLAPRARRAAEILASRQQQPGYWLTSYTDRPIFEGPHVELNTYLPSVIVDVLDPVANAAGVQSSVERARRFLTAQIEADGLVRYHGRPDAPTIGTLGCAITPDADDTALVWRIAPAVRTELRTGALKTLAAYRTADGLYRTWLAPKDRYQCLDPGADPDPADIAIQMHVFQLLSKVDPPAANALCGALTRAVDDDRIWVYYKAAPLIPILRQADLRASGCPLRLPESRQRTTVPGQELWLSAARMLDRLQEGGGARPAASDVLGWLQTIAEDDFAYVRRSPPFLYHNDDTATVPRFYWSEEFGYALWLRLYVELGRQASSGAR